MTELRTSEQVLLAQLCDARRRVAELESVLGRHAPASDDSSVNLRNLDGPIAQLFDGLDEVIWFVDVVNNRRFYVSSAYERITGYRREDVYADPDLWINQIHADDRARVVGTLLSVDLERFRLEYRIVAADGSIRWIANRGYAIRDDQGQTIRVVGIGQDITDRKRAEENLLREKQFIDQAVNSLPGMFYLLDETGRFLRWNVAFLEATGYAAEEVARMHPLEFFTGDDRHLVAERIRQGFTTGEATAEATLVAKDGRCTPYYFTGKLVVLDGLRCLVGMGINVEERRRLEEQLRHAQKMQAVGQLAGGIAHDFNNLLTVICCCSEILLTRHNLAEPGHEMIEQIHQAGRRAADLTRQLLAFGRKTVLESKVLNLNDLVINLQTILRPLMGEDVLLALDLARDLGHVKADPGQIEQVIMNLAVNAHDAMPQGGKITIATADVRPGDPLAPPRNGSKPRAYVLLSVSDTGHGMTPDVQSHMFEPFFSTKGLGKGTGLGLATVYGIIQQSGGKIAFHSEPGRGTTFQFWLPRVEESLPVEPLPAPGRPLIGTETILLVEDEADVRSLARAALSEQGYAVLEARDGQDALTLARQHGKIHLLVTDVVMPVVGGRQLAEQLRQDRPDVKILYMSGYTDDAVVRRGVLAEEVAFLQKPFTPLELLEKVREVLDGPPRG